MARSPRSCSASTTTGTSTQGIYEGWYCPRCADFKTDRARRGQPLPDPPDRAREREGGELVLPAVRVPGAARAALRRAPGLRHAAEPLQRGALVHQERPARPLAQPPAAQVGRAGAVGRQPGHLRLDRRAAQLLHGALLRARGRGPDGPLLARDGPPDRQGHPQVPRGLLARAADGGRDRGARARRHPRLPAAGRPQDVQVARQRDRPVPGHRRSTGPTRCASTCCARSASARTARSRPRASRRATTPSWPTSTATSRAARSR